MPGSSPKRKGDGYERELAKYFNEKVFDGSDQVQRMPLSGGGAIKSSGGSDLKNTPYVYVEAKRTEKFKIHESMRQVEENIEISKSKDMQEVGRPHGHVCWIQKLQEENLLQIGRASCRERV